MECFSSHLNKVGPSTEPPNGSHQTLYGYHIYVSFWRGAATGGNEVGVAGDPDSSAISGG